MTTTTPRQVGYAAVAAAQGNSDNVQVLWLGNDDALPYLIWQSNDSGAWSANSEPMLTSRPKGFDALAMCRGYQNNLCTILIDRETGQPYLLEQYTDGSWKDQGFPVPYTDDSPRYSKVVMVPGNSGNLQVLLLDTDGGPHLIWQSNSNGSWNQGTLPAIAGTFQTMAAGNDAIGDVQSVWIGTDGTPWLLWQAYVTRQGLNVGDWDWSQLVADTSIAFKDVTIHLGNDSNLQVVLLSTGGLPYLTWLDNDATVWSNTGALTVPANTSFAAVTSGYAYDYETQCLAVLLLEATTGQVYALGQNPSFGYWFTAGQVNSSNDHPAGFSAFSACAGYQNDLIIPLIGADNRLPYLLYESDQWSTGDLDWSGKFYWYGMLPLPDPLVVETYASPPLSIEQVFSDNDVSMSQTPGNVAICLSGGGSRAMSAGMGQLQALSTLTLNGESLLSQAKAISTVSGGSWVGQTYSYLDTAGVSDSDFLGTYVDPTTWTTDSVNVLADTTIGARALPWDMCLAGFVAEAALEMALGTPPSMIWQVQIGERILEYYELYKGGSYGYPTDSFTYNDTTLDALQEGNPALVGETFFQIASQLDSSRATRPLPICNMSLAVAVSGNDSNDLAAPVQGTPFYTGVVNYLDYTGTNGVEVSATDANNLVVGGGLCQSFAFNSFINKYSEEWFIDQPRQWSLTDMIGVSSAAIGAAVWAILGTTDDATLDEMLDEYARHGKVRHPELLCIGPDGRPRFTDETKARIHRAVADYRAALVSTSAEVLTVPQYYYWSPSHLQKIPNMKPTRFADGGFLENTGVAGALSYTDIDAVIAFVNSEVAFESTKYGVVDSSGAMLPNTNYKVDDQVAVLFGYQAYDSDRGYITFASDGNTGTMSYCQIFPSESFGPLLQGLAMAGSGTTTPPAQFQSKYPTTFLQTLTTVENQWFNVDDGRTIQVLWCYLNDVRKWHEKLDSSVEKLFIYEDDGLTSDFPHYSTITATRLTACQVNMLANLTAWCVCGNSTNSAPFLNLFK